MKILKKLHFFLFVTCLFGMGQAFALDCATGTGWGDFLTQAATKGSDDYYEIDTPEKLAWLSCKMKHDNNNFKAAKVKLTQSIDMQGNLGKVFIPIAAGTGTPPLFAGIFDGQGFTISNLYINASEINNADVSTYTGKSKNGATAYAQNIGLFGILSGGTIKNLTLKDAQIYAASSAGSTGINSDKPISVGTLVGWVNDASTIENCVASGSIETSGATNRVGGIVGNVKTITITNCVSSVSVTASGENTNVGGIVGALRNGGKVNMSSCVYSGNSLYTVDGSVGAIAGSYEKVGSISTEDLYYSEEYCENLDEGDTCSGIGSIPDNATFNSTSTDDLNSEEVVCNLNGGTWENDSCSGAKTDAWSVGQSDVSMNGSDGYKITFNANGGTFASGAKTSKILAKDAVVTADEIGVPTREGKKFAGWATTADAEEPTDLGVAHAAETVYAVWYDFYEVSFKTGCDTAFFDAKFPDSTKTKTVSVAKHGTISVDGFSVPTVYETGSDENKEKYYFTGWAYAPKSFGANDTIAEKDTLHLSAIDVTAPVTLYAVWTKAPTFSVTFDASLHGKTEVHFVRMYTAGETVSRPDTVITDAGYKVVGWCIAEECTEENEYSFADSLTGNLVLHARWEMETYSIVYELDGGVNADTNPTTYNVNSGDIVFAAPTKAGASFEGWFYDSGFTNPATQIGAGSTGDKTVYAKWTYATYTIQYLSGKAISATVNGTTKIHGDTIALRDAPPQFAVVGCTLDGWSKVDYDQEGYAVDYEFGALYTDNADLKLFPHWTCGTYNISYEMYGVSATNRNPSTYTGPAKVSLENAFDPAKKDYFMDQWYKDATFKTVIRDIQNIDADLTLYAKWYNKITYKPGSNVSGAKDSVYKKYFDTTYTFKSSIKTYVRANYTLDGWSTTDGGEKVYELGGSYTTNENLTLYPHWAPEAFPIVYNNIEGATFETPNPETYTVEDGAIVLNSPSKPGYNFLGWTITENSDEYVDGIAAGSTGDKTFYAQWEKVFPFLVGDYGAIKIYEGVGGKLAAELDGSSNETVDIPTDVQVDTIRFNRVFNSGKMSTVMFPFTIDTSEVHGGKFYEFALLEKNGNKWTATVNPPEAGTIVANRPYLVMPSETAPLTFDLSAPVTFNTSEMHPSTSGDWSFNGTYVYKKFAAGDPELGRAYGFAASASNGVQVGQFVKAGTGAWLRPMRAYLVYNGSSLTRSINASARPSMNIAELPELIDVKIQDANGKVVGWGSLDTRTGEFKVDRWFDLQGRRLNGKPTTKGTYYNNGKKVIVK